MESYEENRVKWLIDKPEGLFLTRRRRSLRRAGGDSYDKNGQLITGGNSPAEKRAIKNEDKAREQENLKKREKY